MNVFYEEEGGFKVGAVLADNGTSLQVEAPHGKRSKIKAANVLFRFDDSLVGLPGAGAQAGRRDRSGLSVGMLRPGRVRIRSARPRLLRACARRARIGGVAAALHSAPMYFYKKGQGPLSAGAGGRAQGSARERRAQASASIAASELCRATQRFELPQAFTAALARVALQAGPQHGRGEGIGRGVRLQPSSRTCGCWSNAVPFPSTHDYHLNRFLFEQFPRG